MSEGYIIVRLDEMQRDLAVFTGRASLVTTQVELGGGMRMTVAEADTSPHLEHAFVFEHPWQAHKWMDRLALRWHTGGEKTSFPEWQVRRDGDFEVGETRIRSGIQRIYQRPERSAFEALLAR